ncbi:hypothetical protein BKA65DRAFT_572875 [Rhexocercosporidium sp. MPI-PUGE-AT-0058]|nr:hypothetical protein BKA65DRAFT_572875 [Rhexocercosporidium sp. MPI-PUGE-AT-0058]
MDRADLSSGLLGNSPVGESCAAGQSSDFEVQEAIETLYALLGGCVSKVKIANGLQAAGGDRDLAFEFLFDEYPIPTRAKVEDTGNSNGKVIKSEPSSGTFGSSNAFNVTPLRETSSESEGHGQPRATPGSDGSQSSKQKLPMRPVTSSFNNLPGTPEAQVSVTRVKTDNDGYDLNSGSDIETSLIKHEAKEEEEEDIYGLPTEDKIVSLNSTPDDDDDDVEIDVNMFTPKEDSSNSDLDSPASDSDGGASRASDMDISDGSDEQQAPMSTSEKEAYLLELFPTAGNQAGIELLVANGDIEEAAAELAEQLGSGRASEDVERSVSPGVGSSCLKKLEKVNKRRAQASTEERQTKRYRRDEDSDNDEEEVNDLDSADKWVLKFLHSDTGMQIELDSGIHPCRIPENYLRQVPGFRSWLDANPPQMQAGIDRRILKVLDVSLNIFNLAMQWVVCSTGQPNLAQRQSKMIEINAFIDLAIFAAKVNIGLGKEGGSFTMKLKAILVKHRALKGFHIRKAFEKLRAGHQVRKLFAQASIRPYVEFHHAGEDLIEAESDSETIDENERGHLNPAQRAAYRKDRFCFHLEFKQIESYQNELLKEFHRVWWTRHSRDEKHGRNHFCRITTLTDPLTNERFEI